MKKFWIPALLSVLLLTGCSVHDEAETSVTTMETEPPGLYVPSSDIETQTNGAVRRYDLPEDGYRWLSAIGDQLLLATDDETAVLSVLTGADCVPTAQLPIEAELLSASCRALYNGFVYYDEAENQAIFLDPQLQEINRLTLPENIQGSPVFSPDGGEIFYTTGQEIRGLDVERKLSRLIKSHSYQSASILDCHFDGKLLSCRVEDAEGVANTIYVSAQTGQTACTENGISALYTYEDRYLALRMDGIIPQSLFGTIGGTAQLLTAGDAELVGALELGGAVSHLADETGLSLAFYDLSTGVKSSAVRLDGIGAPDSILADRWTGCVWILSADTQSGTKVLLRWDPKATPTEDSATCIGTLYTRQVPDEAGLKACQTRVNALNKTYGVRIRIWQDAVKYPGSHIMIPEHQTAAINTMLNALEPVLAEFPKNFLLKSTASQIRICIVRSVDGIAQSVQYRDDDDAFIVLSSGADVRAEFIRGLGYIVDSHVLGNSPKYDSWNDLNPEGFTYGTVDQAYLDGDSRAFADESAMRSATDDRSRILYEALQPDNGELFRSPTMQNKLLLVCQAIRDAWNLERKTESYPWEQYLNQSIAYQK